jgi:hypothetical protein
MNVAPMRKGDRQGRLGGEAAPSRFVAHVRVVPHHPPAAYGASPSRWAIAAASPRLAALSLLRMWETWTPAVRTLM